MAVVFIESKYILSKNITNVAEKYFFAGLAVAKKYRNITEKIISSMYKNNIQIRKEEDLSIFYKVDLPLLWFLNTISCHR